ncbi:hypothetical protein PENSPDRAFT_734098 [Peniophora sp. CONT]|nr:hypothetical protein PENSPDRAFT_734098 [Peniophora sp. CONT]
MLQPYPFSSRRTSESRSNTHPRSFRLSYPYGQDSPLKGKLDRQLLCNKPVDLTWLLNAPRHHDTVRIDSVELDTAHDLLLLLHYEQPRHYKSSSTTSDTIKIFPVQLSNPVTPSSHGMTNAHYLARNAVITVPFDKGDNPQGGPTDTMEIEMTLCGDYFALFFRYTKNQRVVIMNWKTGHKVARIDSDLKRTDTDDFENLVEPPRDITQFAWLAPNAFMIVSVHADLRDALYLYRLNGHERTSGRSPSPFAQSVVLEFPRWKPEYRRWAASKGLEVITGPWSEHLYPGALSYNASNRVTVLLEDYTSGPTYDIRYVLRNDVLVNHFLGRYNGRTLPWEHWNRAGAAVFTNSPSTEVQVCGWTVLCVLRNPAKGNTVLEASNFNPAQIDPRMGPGGIMTRQIPAARECGMFESNIETMMPFRLVSFSFSDVGCVTQFILGAGRIFYSKDGRWKYDAHIPV